MSEQDLEQPTQIQAWKGVKSDAIISDAPWPKIYGYEIVRELGRGGMGLVFLARQTLLDRYVALKTIQAADSDLEEMLVAEARIAGKLEHPSIVPVHEFNTSRDPWFFSMGYVEGEDLSRRLSRQVYSVEQCLALAYAMCDALEHAHGKGVLHLDIKPANILLDKSGRPRLTDFGLSAVHVAKVQQGAFGTPQFMPPEQATGRREQICEASDIYSLGAVLYASLAGRPPLVAASPEDLLMKVVSREPESLRHYGVKAPRKLDAIILKCLKKAPAERYQSAAELRADLKAFEAGEPIKAKPPGVFSRVGYLFRRHVLAASVSGSAVSLLMMLFAFMMVRSYHNSMELDHLRGEYRQLLNDQRLLELRLMNGFAEEFRQTKIAVAREQSANYAEMEDWIHAAEYAAEGLLAQASASDAYDSKFQEVLSRYAEMVGADVKGDEALVGFASKLVAAKTESEEKASGKAAAGSAQAKRKDSAN